MSLYLLSFPIVLILGFLMSLKDTSINRSVYVYILISYFLLLVSLRSISVGEEIGSDTPTYYSMFLQHSSMSWQEVLNEFLNRYIHRSTEFEAGYVLIEKLLGVFSNSWHVFVFIVNLLFFLPFARLLIKGASRMRQLIFAFLFYIVFVQNYLMCAGRQNYAVGLCVISMLYALDNKYLKSYLFILLASFIHTSSLIFVVAIVLGRMNSLYVKKMHLMSFCVFPLILFMGRALIFMAGDVMDLTKYSNFSQSEDSSKIFPFVMLIFSLLIYILLKKSDLERSIYQKKIYSVMPIMTMLVPLCFVSQVMVRLVLYFYIYLSLLIPFAIDSSVLKKDVKVVYMIVAILLLILSVSIYGGGLKYSFFWDNPYFL